ncbi:hypothetical protein [Absidia glauca]|uniref:Uncharacterized protein n=1 Tax=Absidia glauca TaxID=4829 RepID=A0A163J6D3_ABSGL|nr:hypothetical protein [Absidia glauca]
MRFLNLKFKKRHRRPPTPPVFDGTTRQNDLDTIGCDFRASLLEDIMRELHSGMASPAATSSFVSPSKRGRSGDDVGPFLSSTPIATPFSPSSPITSSSETNHNNNAASAHKGPDGRLLKIDEEEKIGEQRSTFSLPSSSSSLSFSSSTFSLYANTPLKPVATPTGTNASKIKVAHNDNNGSSSRDHHPTSGLKQKVNVDTSDLDQTPLSPLHFDRLLRSELRLIESRKTNYYSVPDLSILRHDWAKHEKAKAAEPVPAKEQQQQHHHHHYHYIISSNQCQSSLHFKHDNQSNMYHHQQSSEPPCHLHSNQTNFKCQGPYPEQQQPYHQEHHHHHHYHSPPPPAPPHTRTTGTEEEESKPHLDQSSDCHQHLPFIVSPCITGVPLPTSTCHP